MRRLFPALFLLALIGASPCLYAQSFSPYTRFGFGYMPDDAMAATRSMGGFTAAYTSPMHINHANPASYGDLSLTTFEVGANVDGATIRTKDSIYPGVNGTVSHVAVGIPLIRNRLGLSFGLLPYSFANYSVASTQADTAAVFSGTGSLYKAYLGLGYKIKDFMIGVNAGYLFGSMSYTRGYQFPDSLGEYNIENLSATRVYGLVYNVGIMYHKRVMKKTPQNSLKSDVFFTFGAQGSSNVNVSTRVSSMWQRYTGVFPAVTIDTPINYADRIGKIRLPYNFSTGVSIGNENWWLAGIDFEYTGWSTYNNPQPALDLGQNWSYGDSWKIRAGGGIVPNYDSRKFFNRVQYKVGFYYGKTELVYHEVEGGPGTHLSDYGATFGFSVPLLISGIYREAARFHFSAAIGSLTPGNNNLYVQNYYRFNFGFTLNNVWFVKRKFD